jgi:hypothetical protein
MKFDLLIIPPFSPLKINFFQTKIKFKKILRAFSNGTKDKKMPAGSGFANPGFVAI